MYVIYMLFAFISLFYFIIYQVLVWWSASSKEAMPWSPMATDKERANIIAVACHG